MKAPKDMRSRLWCFTNYKLEIDYQKIIDQTSAVYIAYGNETCPTTGRPHHQGFVLFESQRCSMKGVVKDMGGAMTVKMCKGSLVQNEDYCSKEGTLIEFGVKPHQGARVDLETMRDQIMSGKRKVSEILVDDPIAYHQYGRTMEKLEDVAMRKRFRTEMTQGIWYWGKTGVGKSHKAYEGFDPCTHYVVANDGGWWDGYTGQETVIFNEFRGSVTFSELLDLCDKWPKTVKRRNREPAPFLAKTLIITSSMAPEDVYRNILSNEESLDQLNRRFQVIHLE